MEAFTGTPTYMKDGHDGNTWAGAIGGFLLGNVLNGGGFGGNGNNAATDAQFANLGNQISSVNAGVNATANNITNQFQHSAILGALNANAKDAVAQGYQNTITSLQGQFAIEKSISDLGTQMQLGFKDAALQTALQGCDIKDTINTGFTRQMEANLLEANTRLRFHEFVTPLQQQIANINVVTPAPTTP